MEEFEVEFEVSSWFWYKVSSYLLVGGVRTNAYFSLGDKPNLK